MKKLTMLLAALLMLLCAAVQAEVTTYDLSDSLIQQEGIELEIRGDTVIIGSPQEPLKVTLKHYSGEITLKDIDVSRLYIKDAECNGISGKTIVINLVGENSVYNNSSAGDSAVLSYCPLVFRGSGSLHAETAHDATGLLMYADELVIEGGSVLTHGQQGTVVRGGIIVKGGYLYAKGTQMGIGTVNGTMTVDGGMVFACCGETGEMAYVNAREEEYGGDVSFEIGTINAAAGYHILAGEDDGSVERVSSYSGEKYLSVQRPEMPVMPETGDGANFVLWMLMLAASVVGVLRLRRRAY